MLSVPGSFLQKAGRNLTETSYRSGSRFDQNSQFQVYQTNKLILAKMILLSPGIFLLNDIINVNLCVFIQGTPSFLQVFNILTIFIKKYEVRLQFKT